MKAHNLLWEEYRTQQTRLAAVPALEAQVQQLLQEKAAWANLEVEAVELRAQAQAHSDALQLAQVELTVLRASQRARDERIFDLEQDRAGLERQLNDMQQRAERAERAQDSRRASMLDGVSHPRSESEGREIRDDLAAVAHLRRQVVGTQEQLAVALQAKAALGAELARTRAELVLRSEKDARE